MPLGDEADSSSFGDIVPDPNAAATMDAVEEKLWRKQCHEALEGVLAELPEEQSAVLRCRYYDGRTLVETVGKLGTTANEVLKRERRGLRELRSTRLAKRVRSFYDFDYYGGTGLGSFRNTGMSIQERYLLAQEREQREL